MVVIVLLVLTASLTAPAQWLSWRASTGLNFDAAVKEASEAVRRGFAPARIDSHFENGEVRYSLIFAANEERIERSVSFRLPASVYALEIEQRKQQGYGPADIAVTTVAGEPVFSVIWAKNEFEKWEAWHDLTAEEVRTRTQTYTKAGLQIVDINAYPTSKGIRFSAIWADAGIDDPVYVIGRDKRQFETERARLGKDHLPFVFNVASLPGETVYSAVFVKNPAMSFEFVHGLSGADFKSFFERQSDAGSAPYMISVYNLSDGPTYAAVFAKEKLGTRSAVLRIGDGDEQRPAPKAVQAAPAAPAVPAAASTFGQRILPIAPVMQRTKVWCWLAVGEMIFSHYGIPNRNPAGDYQCGIIGTIMSNSSCFSNCYNPRCIRPSGSNAATVSMLADYAWASSQRALNAQEGYDMPYVAVKQNIDNGRPIIAGISPNRQQFYEGAEHVALIVGYVATADGVDLIVNDPYPYEPAENWYIRNGAIQTAPYQYRIGMGTFSRKLYWHWSISNISFR